MLSVEVFRVLGILSHCRYSNQVVAKLPFEPHWILAKVAHRGLKIPNPNDCAVVSCLCCLHIMQYYVIKSLMCFAIQQLWVCIVW